MLEENKGVPNPEPNPTPPTFSQRILMYALIIVLTLAFLYWVCVTEHR